MSHFERSPQRASNNATKEATQLAHANDMLRTEIGRRRRVEQEGLRLLDRLATAEEQERRRIAREMHDQFGQQLTALKLQAGRLKAECDGRRELREQVEALEVIAAQMDRDIDFLVWELRPPTLDGVGLRRALAQYLQTWSSHCGIAAELHADEFLEDRLESKIKAALYQIAREALTNIAKHAKADRVDVVLLSCRHHTSLVVEDRGVGFDRGDAAIIGRGLGLLGMRERAALVGGTLQIESTVGRGTTVLVRVPLPARG